MARNRIQKLILQSEYIEFKDNVLAEAPFIELDKCGEPLRQVLLGLTENCFIVASENLPDYVEFPYVKYDADVDLDIDSLELEWIVPIGFVELVAKQQDKIISVDAKNGRVEHFMISDIWGSAKKDWIIWKEALSEVHNDPYSYTRCLFKDFAIPDKIYDNALITRRRSQIYQKKARSLETLTNKVMTKMYEIQDEIASKSSLKMKEITSKQSLNTFNCCTTENSSQTHWSNDSDDEDQPKKKRKSSKIKGLLRGFCLGGKAKRRPT